MQATEKIWMNGELVDWDDARIHVGAHGLHYGTGVFEGIRCYDTPQRPRGVPPHRSHAAPARLGAADQHAAAVLGRRAARRDCNDLLGANGLSECYIRPIAFYGFGQLGVSARDNPVETVIMCWPWGTYLGEEALQTGIRTKISSWQRIPANVVPHASKATGVYLNSMLAVNEAQRAGLRRGDHADAGRERSPTARARRSSSSGAASSTRPTSRPGSCTGSRATRSSRSPSDLGYEVLEKTLIRSDLYLADEVFMCGTAAEVTPVRSVDDHEIGVGPITQELQKAYLDTVRGAERPLVAVARARARA